MTIRVQIYGGFKIEEFSQDYCFQGKAVTGAAGAKRFTRMQDDTLTGRFFKCKGKGVEVIVWDNGNGWMSIHEVKGSDIDVRWFWQELERLCQEVEPKEGAMAAA